MSLPVVYQRIEAAALLVASVYFYVHLHFNLLVFVLLILSIDAFMLGYATKDNTIGAHVYNIGHSLIIPLLLLIIGTAVSSNLMIGGSLIWTSHIGMDRMFGYGLKYESNFTDTHLGRIGKNKK